MITDTALRDGLELMQHVLASPSDNRSMIQETIKQYHRVAIHLFPAAAEALLSARAENAALREALVALLDHAADIGEVPADKCGICAKARALLAEPPPGSAT